MTSWSRLVRGESVEPSTAAAVLPLLAGAVHRLAWSGPDEEGDRARALEWFQRSVHALGPTPAATVLDWWLDCGLAEGSGLAYSIDRDLPPPLGGALRDILDLNEPRKLEALRRPRRFREVLEELSTLASQNEGKIAAAKHIFNDANADCHVLLRAAEEGQPPPSKLRLARLGPGDAEAWASESTVARTVTAGTPVWHYLVKRLLMRGALVDDAIRLWPRKGDVSRPLPKRWEQVLDDTCGALAPLCRALVADADPDAPAQELLRGAGALKALATAPDGDEVVRARLFGLVREAAAAEEVALPGWAGAIARSLDTLAAAVDRADDALEAGDARDLLSEARAALASLDLPQAREWLNAAEEEQRRASHGMDAKRRREALERLALDLTRAGFSAPPEEPDPEGWGARIEHARGEAATALRHRLAASAAAREALVGDHDLGPLHAGAVQALDRSRLGDADKALTELQAAVEAAGDADDAWLGEALAALRQAGRALSVDGAARHGLRAGIRRAADRRDAGLAWEPLARDLRRLIDTLAEGSAPAVVAARDGGRIAWVHGGVPCRGAAPEGGIHLGPVQVAGSVPPDAAERVGGWARVVPAAAEEGIELESAYFVIADGVITGPWRRDGGESAPADGSVAIGVLDARRFAALFGRLDLGDGTWLTPQPPSLQELIIAGADIRDALDAERLAAWLARELDGAVPADAIARWLAQGDQDGVPEAIRAARLDRMREVFGRAAALQGERARAVDAYLASEEGRAAVQEAVERRTADEVGRIEALITARREHLEQELDALRTERDRAQDELSAMHARVETRRAEVDDELAAVEGLLKDTKSRVLVELLGGARSTGPVDAPSAPVAPIRAARFEADEAVDLPELVGALAGETWPRELVANLLLSMLTGRWTLLAGLPGVGKSTLVRSLLTRLGHGPGTSRYLELVVRRDWQDDTALFGFWHPTERAWMPSSDGFVEHLLRAADDARSGYGGVYPVLVEELNLASPEYYLARPISALEAAEPTIHLYDPEMAASNAERYPPRFRVPDGVRMLGTVNVDDTVERLSPRFLSRASVLWLEPDGAPPRWDAASDAVAARRVRWSTLARLTAAGPAPGVGALAVQPVVDFLRARRVPGAPTHRTTAAIAAYLRASVGVLPATDAEDLQILQRILPPLRGVGVRWRGLLDDLRLLLEERGWRRSAGRVAELRERGEELGDWYDFFHT